MKLIRRIPARTETVEFAWLRCNFTTMGPGWRRIREGHGEPKTKCFWCRYEFLDGDLMALGSTGSGNKVLCQSCARELEAGDTAAAGVCREG